MNFKWGKFIKEVRSIFILIIIAFTVKSTLVEIYVVPTGSMENTIMTGDMLIGNKFIYGLRTPIWIGVPWSRIGFDFPWIRFPAFKKVHNNDVTIFEFPRDPFQKYVKRCIGIPGDSIYIDSGKIYVNGNELLFPENGKYVKGYIYGTDKKESSLYPFFKGNRDNLKEFIVPYKGMKIDFYNINDWQTIITLLVQDGNDVKVSNKTFTMIDPNEIARTHGFLKNKIIRFFTNDRQAMLREQKDKVEFINKLNSKYKSEKLINPWYVNYRDVDAEYFLNNLLVNGKALVDMKTYILNNDYYFFMGDNRDSSYDSRFWGFVPDSQILGTPLFALLNIFKFKLRMKVIS